MLSSGKISGCATGAFVNGLRNLSAFQKMTGKKLAVILFYVHWLDAFPLADVEVMHNNGSVPLLTWEPWVSHSKGTLEAIASRESDDYVRQFIQAAKDWGKPLLLRFAHEMNGDWYPWDGFHNGQDTAAKKYKNAWAYIYNVRQELKADNIELVWSPNNNDQPAADWNRMENYFPGDQYVDWVAVDGYNWGFSKWEPFAAVFGQIYQRVTQLSSQPIMIGEFGSAEQGGDKAAWIKEAFHMIKTQYPKIKAFCWFDINKERDWRVNSTEISLKAYRQGISNSYFTEILI
ncbi:MAG: glycosyl hydrolase [Candidatus Margulisiibacteriota bacterium]